MTRGEFLALAYVLIWAAVLQAPEIIWRQVGWLGLVVFYLLVVSVVGTRQRCRG